MGKEVLRGLLRSIALFCIAGCAVAQPYPVKPVTIVVPYGAGGNADLAARALGAVAVKLRKL